MFWMRMMLLLAVACTASEMAVAQEDRPSEEEIGRAQIYLTPPEALEEIFDDVAAVDTMLAVLTGEEMRAWGWRIPFLIGAAAAIVAMMLRGSLKESASVLWWRLRTPSTRPLKISGTEMADSTSSRSRTIWNAWRSAFPRSRRGRPSAATRPAMP